jgi:hypothetical protein
MVPDQLLPDLGNSRACRASLIENEEKCS